MLFTTLNPNLTDTIKDTKIKGESQVPFIEKTGGKKELLIYRLKQVLIIPRAYFTVTGRVTKAVVPLPGVDS
jgi:hypothetical protein